MARTLWVACAWGLCETRLRERNRGLVVVADSCRDFQHTVRFDHHAVGDVQWVCACAVRMGKLLK